MADMPEGAGGGGGHGGTGGLLTSKWGPMPVWVWALAGLGVAWAIAKYRSNQAAKTAATSTASATDPSTLEGMQSAPQFIIENNMPGTSPSAPITVPAGPAPPVVTPPGTLPNPPTNIPPGSPPAVGHPTTPPPRVAPPKRAPVQYRVQPGDNLSTIAAKYHVKGGWQELFTFNTTPGVRTASSIKTIKSRGPNHLVAGEDIFIPPQ